MMFGQHLHPTADSSDQGSRASISRCLFGLLSLVIMFLIAGSTWLHAQGASGVGQAAKRLFGGENKKQSSTGKEDEPAKNDTKNKSGGKNFFKLTEDEEQPEDEEKIEVLPSLDEMILPSEHALLNGRPVDWIVLKKGERVIVTGLIYPRPDTIAKMEAAIETEFAGRRPRDEDERDEFRSKREEMHKIDIVFPEEDEAEDFQIHIDHVERIIYHEDLILQRTNKMMDQGRALLEEWRKLKSQGLRDEASEKLRQAKRKMRDAYDMLSRLQRRLPDWPGITDVQDRLLFFEALNSRQKDEPEAALVFLEDLYARNPEYEGLQAELNAVSELLIASAFESSDFRRGHHYINRLKAVEQNNSVVAKWGEKLLADATAVFQQARQAEQAGDYISASEFAKQAALIWPETPGLREGHARITSRFQTLKVGVLRLPGETSAYFLPTEADLRKEELTQASLFDVDSTNEAVQYRTRIFEQWEPLDLGRRTLFSLRQSRTYWESQPVVTAHTVVSALSDRLDPSGPHFDERLASYVKTMRVRSPFEMELEFQRVPLSVEALLRATRAPNHPDRTDESNRDGPRSEAILPARFHVHSRDEKQIVFRRTIPEPDDESSFHISEIVEVKLPSHRMAIQKLIRGEVSLLPHVRSWDVPRFEKNETLFVQKYALPVTHVIQVNPKSAALANREMRRAMVHAINRERLMREIVLKDPNAERGRVVTAPFHSGSSAYDRLIEPRQTDLSLAFALADAARKQFQGEIPKLTMLCVPDPIAAAAAKEIVKSWKRVGIEVNLITGKAPPGEGERWDIIYRTSRMAEPAIELWPFLTLEPSATVEAVYHLPDQLRLELIELENVSDRPTATRVLRRLHRHLWAEVQYIPLWEVDDYLVIRKGDVRGFRPRPMHTYQDVESWTARPLYPVY